MMSAGSDRPDHTSSDQASTSQVTGDAPAGDPPPPDRHDRTHRVLALALVIVGAGLKFVLGLSWGLMAGLVFAVGILLSDVREWNDFWFAPMNRSKLVAWRIALGAVVLASALSVAPNLERFYGAQSIVPQPDYLPNFRFGLMRWWDTPAAAWTIWGCLVGAALLIIGGRGLRVASVVAWYGLMSLHQANPFILNSADDMIRLFAFLFMVYVWFAGSGRPTWLMRLVQLQLTVIYPASFLGKIGGLSWRDGTASLLALGLKDFERFPVPDLVRESLLLGLVMTWSTLLLEFALAVLLWYRPTRPFGIVAGLAMHLGFAWAMSLGFFTPILLVGYLMFVDDSVFDRLSARLSARWSARWSARSTGRVFAGDSGR